MVEWLSEPWWAGVQGIVAVVGIVAIGIAAAQFVLQLNSDGPPAMAFTVSREGADILGDREMVTVTVTARPMGTHVLYEPEWRVWGKALPLRNDLPPRIDVDSDPVSLELRMRRQDLAKVRVGIQWVVPRRFQPFMGAARCSVAPEGVYERWLPYRWRYWPHRTNGRWVAGKDRSRRSRLTPPT